MVVSQIEVDTLPLILLIRNQFNIHKTLVLIYVLLFFLFRRGLSSYNLMVASQIEVRYSFYSSIAYSVSICSSIAYKSIFAVKIYGILVSFFYCEYFNYKLMHTDIN